VDENKFHVRASVHELSLMLQLPVHSMPCTQRAGPSIPQLRSTIAERRTERLERTWRIWHNDSKELGSLDSESQKLPKIKLGLALAGYATTPQWRDLQKYAKRQNVGSNCMLKHSSKADSKGRNDVHFE
jgi:hypothetical protein